MQFRCLFYRLLPSYALQLTLSKTRAAFYRYVYAPYAIILNVSLLYCLWIDTKFFYVLYYPVRIKTTLILPLVSPWMHICIYCSYHRIRINVSLAKYDPSRYLVVQIISLYVSLLLLFLLGVFNLTFHGHCLMVLLLLQVVVRQWWWKDTRCVYQLFDKAYDPSVDKSLPFLFKRYMDGNDHITKYGGTRLDLAVCKQLVDLMGGTLTA